MTNKVFLKKKKKTQPKHIQNEINQSKFRKEWKSSWKGINLNPVDKTAPLKINPL